MAEMRGEMDRRDARSAWYAWERMSVGDSRCIDAVIERAGEARLDTRIRRSH